MAMAETEEKIEIETPFRVQTGGDATEWSDISDEKWREYFYPNGESIRVPDPASLRVKRDGTYTGAGSRDSHRIECKHGIHYYVPPGWLGMRFAADQYSF